MRIFLVLIAVIIVAGMLGGLMNSVIAFRTDELTQVFNETTAAGVTTANVQLSTDLWKDNIAYTSISSNNTSDSPAASSYNATNRQLNIAGLLANSSRTLTIDYDIEALGDYPGIDDAILHFPTVIVVGLVIFACAAIIAVMIAVVKGRSF